MKQLTRLLYAALALGSIAISLSVSALMIPSVHLLGWLSYPAHFGLSMMLTGIVLVILLPAHRKRTVSLPFVEKFLTVNDKRFEKRPWPWIRKRGPFTLTMAVSFFVGPLAAAVVMRFLGLNEHKAWVYAFITCLISSLFWVSLYLGVFGLIRSALGAFVH